MHWQSCSLDLDSGNLSQLPGDDDLLRLPTEINKRLLIDDDQPVVISIGWHRTTFTQQKVAVKCLQSQKGSGQSKLGSLATFSGQCWRQVYLFIVPPPPYKSRVSERLQGVAKKFITTILTCLMLSETGGHDQYVLHSTSSKQDLSNAFSFAFEHGFFLAFSPHFPPPADFTCKHAILILNH